MFMSRRMTLPDGPTQGAQVGEVARSTTLHRNIGLEMTTLSCILANIGGARRRPSFTDGFPMFSLIVLTISAIKASRAAA
jgi:hypothetical protein